MTTESCAPMRGLRPKRLTAVLPIAVAMLGLAGLAGCKPSSTEGQAGGPSASASAPPSASVSAKPKPPTTGPGSNVPCELTGPTKPLVVGKLSTAPIEVWGDPDESRVAVGFVTSPTKAIGFVLDPSTLSAKASFTKNAVARITRVVPYYSRAGFKFSVNAKDPKAIQRSPLTVGTNPPLKLGVFKNAIMASEGGSTGVMWMLPTPKPIDDARSLHVPEKGGVVALRMARAAWLGFVSPEAKPVGELSKVPGDGAPSGRLTLGWNGREVLLLFAKKGKKGKTDYVMTRTPFGKPAGAPVAWTPPKGPGGKVTLPSVFGLPDGRWIFVWAEGKAEAELRMQTYNALMEPAGKPVAVTSKGTNGRAGAVAVGKNGGVIFMQTGRQNWDRLGAKAIRCP